MHLDEVEQKLEDLEKEIENLKTIVSLFVYHTNDFNRYLKMYKELSNSSESYMGITAVVTDFNEIAGDDRLIWQFLQNELNLTKATINKHIEEVKSKFGRELGKKAAEKLKNKTSKLAHHMLNAVRAAIIKQIEVPPELV